MSWSGQGDMLVGFPSSCKCHTSLWAIWSDRSFPNLHLWQNRCVANVPVFFLCVSPPTHPSFPSFSSYRGITAGFCFHCRDAEAPQLVFSFPHFFLSQLSLCLFACLGGCLFVCCVYSESYLLKSCLLFTQIGSMHHPPLIFPLACRWSLLLTS